MCISGAVFTENVVVEQLTHYVWTGGNPYDDKSLESVACLFKAFSAGLADLEKFYGSLQAATSPSDQHFFPFPHSYSDSCGQEVNFKYISRLNENKAIYLAESHDGRKLIVKFVQRYNSCAHRLLAINTFAPQLHHSSLDNAETNRMGALGMVVMDFVIGENAYKLYSDDRLPDAVYNQVKKAIDILHAKSFVFGDLRLPNIIITDQQKNRCSLISTGVGWIRLVDILPL